MIAMPRAVRVFAHREPVDMRKSFDTLAAVVRLAMANDIMGADVFVFVGKRRRHAKVLWWDGTGWCCREAPREGTLRCALGAAWRAAVAVDDDGARSVLGGLRAGDASRAVSSSRRCWSPTA